MDEHLSVYVIAFDDAAGHYILVKTDLQGTPDTSFGPRRTGKLVLDAFDFETTWIAGLQVLNDGTIYIAGDGISRPPGSSAWSDHFVARISADGHLDTGFGEDGVQIFDTSQNEDDHIKAFAVGPSGQVLLAGTVHSPNAHCPVEGPCEHPLTFWWLDRDGFPQSEFGRLPRRSLPLSRISEDAFMFDISSIRFTPQGQALVGGLAFAPGSEAPERGDALATPFGLRVHRTGKIQRLSRYDRPGYGSFDLTSESHPGVVIPLMDSWLLHLRQENFRGHSVGVGQRYSLPKLDPQVQSHFHSGTSFAFSEHARAVSILDDKTIITIGFQGERRRQMYVTALFEDGKLAFKAECADILAAFYSVR